MTGAKQISQKSLEKELKKQGFRKFPETAEEKQAFPEITQQDLSRVIDHLFSDYGKTYFNNIEEIRVIHVPEEKPAKYDVYFKLKSDSTWIPAGPH